MQGLLSWYFMHNITHLSGPYNFNLAHAGPP